METEWGVLCTAVLRAQRHPRISDSSLQIALSIADSPRLHSGGSGSPGGHDDEDVEATRITALVDLACGGDAEAFGQLYDHYLPGVFRFVYYRVGSRSLAEDLTSETFTRALRSVRKFQWQGKDFGAWLTTIARNIITDHYKSSRSRLEIVADEVPESTNHAPSPEDEVITGLTSALVMEAVAALPDEQRDCLLMRFVQGLSIAQTAEALGRTEGAIKQLQLRAVRKLARTVTKDDV